MRFNETRVLQEHYRTVHGGNFPNHVNTLAAKLERNERLLSMELEVHRLQKIQLEAVQVTHNVQTIPTAETAPTPPLQQQAQDITTRNLNELDNNKDVPTYLLNLLEDQPLIRKRKRNSPPHNPYLEPIQWPDPMVLRNGRFKLPAEKAPTVILSPGCEGLLH